MPSNAIVVPNSLAHTLLYWAIERPVRELLIATIIAALIIVYRHKGNIQRLRAGTENVFSMKSKAK